MTSKMDEILAASAAEVAAAEARAEAAGRALEAGRAAAREEIARSAVEAAEIEMAVRLSNYIGGGGLERRRRIVREIGLITVLQRYGPSSVAERNDYILETRRRKDPPADPDNYPDGDRPAETVAPLDDGPPLPG